MTEKERYKQAFDAVHPSSGFSERLMENINNAEKGKDQIMKNENKRTRKAAKGLIAAIAAAFVLVIGTGTVYAANVGGIQRTIQLWTRGEQTEASLVIDNSESFTQYTVSYTDAEGVSHEVGGGGIAIDMFGNEHQLTEEEIMEHLDMPDVVFNEEDGTVKVFWRAQELDITDKFEDGVCYCSVTDGEKTYYLTVKSDGGYSINTNKYARPW